MQEEQITLPSPANKNHLKTVGLIFTLSAVLTGFVILSILKPKVLRPPTNTNNWSVPKFSTFKSENEFREYLTRSTDIPTSSSRATDLTAPLTAEMDKLSAQPAQTPSYSGTNVQVAGIDEPDIVKTNGQQIFVSQNNYVYPLRGQEIMPLSVDSAMIAPFPFPNQQPLTNIIQAFPPQEIKKLSKVDTTGDLLLTNNRLIVLGTNELTGYDTTDTTNPTQKWKFSLDSAQVLTSRLYEGNILLFTSKFINSTTPCPIPLYKIEENTVSLPCTQIYHPDQPSFTDTTYTAFTINPQDGQIIQQISFTGSTSESTIYVSAQNIYLTYNQTPDTSKLYYQFFQENGQGMLPSAIVEKIRLLSTYDISQSSKINEIQILLNSHFMSLGQDARATLEANLQNKLSEFSQKHIRELSVTGIVKITIKDFTIANVSSIPGHPLNQFSLDEKDGNLRIAVTLDTNSAGWFFPTNSTSDVYILNSQLQKIGEITGLGQGERIYSTRFIGDRGYVVTFRQTDPFYVLDLTNPTSPKLTGELKIPGYSSYLHPLGEHTVLGVGKIDQFIKLSIFDVSDPTNPKETSTFTTSEYYSDVLTNHKAFTINPNTQTFFIPGAKGYIFNFKDNKLELAQAIDEPATRAIYIGDYLYLVSSQKITILSQSNWTRVNQLEF